MKDSRIDRLYELLPVVYRTRDYKQGEPLKALLRVISEQVNLVEDDITQLYENWFIETCEDWVVPYLGDIVGYEPVHEAGEPSVLGTERGRVRNKILFPRKEIANTLRYRRRKGTLALLELLANDVAGWPARVMEFSNLLGCTQHINHLRLDRGRMMDLRNGKILDLINTPFDTSAHSVDIRRINSVHSRGYYNTPSIGVFVWRLKSLSVTQTHAYCLESAGSHCFTFSILGNSAPLWMHPEPETDPTHIAEELNLPVPIRRKHFETEKEKIYGMVKSLQLWKGVKKGRNVLLRRIPAEQIVVANLSGWEYLPKRNTVAVDPILGRIAFPPRLYPKNGVWVNYHYGFSWELGGGEYLRSITQPEDVSLYQVCTPTKFEDSEENRHHCDQSNKTFPTIIDAIKKWHEDQPENAVIEILDSSVYSEPINIDFTIGENENNSPRSLQLRAAHKKRPVIRLLDWKAAQEDAFSVMGSGNDRFTLDGIMITGRGLQVSGGLAELEIRHSTLVPGWTLGETCDPDRPAEPSLEIFSAAISVHIDNSIMGSIQIDPAIMLEDVQSEEAYKAEENEATNQAQCQGIGKEVRLDPIKLSINDSVIDATNPGLEAIGAPGCPVAHTALTIKRSTVFGHLQVHSIELGENCIFEGRIIVARRQQGCLRFCYITPESRTPKRYRCQPDLVEKKIEQSLTKPTEVELAAAKQAEQLRVRPQLNSFRYGTPSYCQLLECCAEEIKKGADDESEMGVFHDLYQPQRMANLKVRLDEYLPARMDVGVILAS